MFKLTFTMSLSEIIPLLLLLFDDIVVVGALFTVASPLLWLEKVEFISLLFNLILILSFVIYTICVGTVGMLRFSPFFCCIVV